MCSKDNGVTSLNNKLITIKDQLMVYKEKTERKWNSFKNTNRCNTQVQNTEELNQDFNALFVILSQMFQMDQNENDYIQYSIGKKYQIKEIKKIITDLIKKYDKLLGAKDVYELSLFFKRSVLNFVKSSHLSLYSNLMGNQDTAFSTFLIIDQVFDDNWPSLKAIVANDNKCTQVPNADDLREILHQRLESINSFEEFTDDDISENESEDENTNEEVLHQFIQHKQFLIEAEKSKIHASSTFNAESDKTHSCIGHDFQAFGDDSSELEEEEEEDIDPSFDLIKPFSPIMETTNSNDSSLNTSCDLIFGVDLLNKTMRHIELSDSEEDE